MIEDITYFIGLFSDKYSSSRSFITDIPEFGGLIISIIKKEEYTFVYCRSVLGLKEFVYSKISDNILLDSVDKYFRSFVNNWDTQIKAEYSFFDNFVSFFHKSILSPISSDTIIHSLKELLELNILSNIKYYKLENIRNRFTEINYFYAEEIENFIIKDYLEINNDEDIIEDIQNIKDIKVSEEDINNLNIEYKFINNGLLTIINEFISSELSVLIFMNDLFYDGVLRNKEKMKNYKYNEYFKDFEDIYNLSKIFIKDLVEEFNNFEYEVVDNTLEDIFIKYNKYKKGNKVIFKDDDKIRYDGEDLKMDNKYDEDKIKYDDDKYEDDDNKDQDNKYDQDNNFKYDDDKYDQDNNIDHSNKLYNIIIKNINYFNSYINFVNTYENTIKNINIKDINKDKLIDTFNIILQRLTKYSPLLTRIISYTDNKLEGYRNLKIFLIKIKKFVRFLDYRQDIQYKKEKTWELCIKYNLEDVKGFYIDEISYQEYRLILLADYLLILDPLGYYLGFLNIKNIDIHEKGDISFYLISNQKINIKYYYTFELQNYKMYILNIKCLSRGIRDRFINNIRKSRKKYSFPKEVIKIIKKDDKVYNIPKIYLKDEEWILLKYKFIINEIIKINEGREFIEIN